MIKQYLFQRMLALVVNAQRQGMRPLAIKALLDGLSAQLEIEASQIH